MSFYVNRAFLIVTSVGAALCVAGNARADIIFDNLGTTPIGLSPVVSGFPYAASFSTGDSPFPLSLVAVVLTADAGVPPSDLSISALLLADSSTGPGSVLETIGNLDEDTVVPGEYGPYTFTGESSFTLSPDTRYWIELTSNDTSLGYVGWLSSGDLTDTIGTAGEYWASDIGNGAFDVFADGTNGGPQLMEVADCPYPPSIPEPSNLALLGAGCCVLGFRKLLARR
jgi:hypothetical protein